MINQKQSYRNVPRGPIGLMNRVYRHIFPGVRQELSRIKMRAEEIPDPELRTQALASIASKQFHCEGGAVYAAANLSMKEVLIPLIVSYQTISDYLDNLCDRSTSMDADDFRLLHKSMLDAVNPDAKLVNYYALRKEQEDDGYLHSLVSTCQSCLKRLPGYSAVKSHVQDLVGLYVDLQVYKHIKPELREQALLDWWELHKQRTPALQWNEFAAATGSTLGVFMLFLAATDPHLDDVEASSIHASYFPHVTGLHIMLDYLIDQEEDKQGGDLNFCNYYESENEMIERFAYIVDEARNDVSHMPASSFHRMIIEGLLALYLTDPKVSEQQEVRSVSKRLLRNSPLTRRFFLVNTKWIRKHMYEK